MKTLLTSDVHLDVSARGERRMADFAGFLRGVDPSRVDRLILLGDLFDFWFEYRHVIFSGYFDVLRAFAALREAGVAVHLICGNHDFWAGRFLETRLGFVVHRESAVMNFGGRRALLVHGDGWNARDWGYRLYKRIARARPVIAAFRFLHPDWAMAVARVVSRSSRRLSASEAGSMGSEARALQAFAMGVLAKGEADIVVCGHSHHPVIEEHPAPTGTGLYINTGDWLHHESYVEWDGETFHLRRAREAGSIGQEGTEREPGQKTDHPDQQH